MSPHCTHVIYDWLCAIVGAPRKQRGRYVGNRFTTDAAPSRSMDTLQAELKKRGFTAKDGALLQLKSYTAEEVKKQFPRLPAHLAGMRIRYFGLDGKSTGFYRFRYFDISPTGWKAHVGKKPLRYAQERDSIAEVYLPPFQSWSELAKKPELPLLITEGEFKAAYATKCELPTIGLGGVWMFRNGKRGQTLLPQLEAFAWEGRPVTICFDSDAATNPNVAAAESVLARELTRRGAQPKIARIPALPAGKKTGLDDYLLARGPEALRTEVLDRAEDYETAAELFKLNEEVIYIRNPPTGIMVRLADDADMSVAAFKEHAYSTRIITERRADGKIAIKSAAAEWLKWPLRATAACITYAPGAPRITAANELNKWPGWGCEPCAGDVRPFLKLFDHLGSGLQDSEKRWLLQWLAFPLQHPGTKLFTAVVVWGRPGTGKSLLGYTMFEVYGQRNVSEIGESELNGKFNEWAANRQFIMGDEMTGGERKRDVADRLKAMITRPFIPINRKFIPEYKIKDVLNFYFTSNHCDAFFIEDHDRRYFVHEVRVEPLEPQFYKEYGEWMKSADGPAALFHYLLHVDMSGFNPHGAAPRTAAKEQMIDGGRSDVESWVFKLKENPRATLRGSEANLWTSGQLLSLYDPAQTTGVKANTLGKKLGMYFQQWGRRNILGRPMPVQERGDRLWIITNEPAEIAKLQKLTEERIYRLYLEQHPEKAMKFKRPVSSDVSK